MGVKGLNTIVKQLLLMSEVPWWWYLFQRRVGMIFKSLNSHSIIKKKIKYYHLVLKKYMFPCFVFTALSSALPTTGRGCERSSGTVHCMVQPHSEHICMPAAFTEWCQCSTTCSLLIHKTVKAYDCKTWAMMVFLCEVCKFISFPWQLCLLPRTLDAVRGNWKVKAPHVLQN